MKGVTWQQVLTQIMLNVAAGSVALSFKLFKTIQLFLKMYWLNSAVASERLNDNSIRVHVHKVCLSDGWSAGMKVLVQWERKNVHGCQPKGYCFKMKAYITITSVIGTNKQTTMIGTRIFFSAGARGELDNTWGDKKIVDFSDKHASCWALVIMLQMKCLHNNRNEENDLHSAATTRNVYLVPVHCAYIV